MEVSNNIKVIDLKTYYLVRLRVIGDLLCDVHGDLSRYFQDDLPKEFSEGFDDAVQALDYMENILDNFNVKKDLCESFSKKED